MTLGEYLEQQGQLPIWIMGIAHTHYLVILTLKTCIKIVGRSANSLTAHLSCLTCSRSCQLSEIDKPAVPWHQVKIPVFTADNNTWFVVRRDPWLLSGQATSQTAAKTFFCGKKPCTSAFCQLMYPTPVALPN